MHTEDKYAWSRLIKKIILGVFIICFTASDSKANGDILTEDFTYGGSGIWFLATNSWMYAELSLLCVASRNLLTLVYNRLLPYTLALLVEVIVELVRPIVFARICSALLSY